MELRNVLIKNLKTSTVWRTHSLLICLWFVLVLLWCSFAILLITSLFTNMFQHASLMYVLFNLNIHTHVMLNIHCHCLDTDAREVLSQILQLLTNN